MLETPHVAVGALIAAKIPNPFIAIPLAFASHFILDKVPHWNPHLNKEMRENGYPTKKSTTIVVADAAIALGIGIFFAFRAAPDYSHSLTILLACFASVLPDVIEAPYFFLKTKGKIVTKWISLHRTLQNDATPFWGLLTQAATVLAASWLIFTR